MAHAQELIASSQKRSIAIEQAARKLVHDIHKESGFIPDDEPITKDPFAEIRTRLSSAKTNIEKANELLKFNDEVIEGISELIVTELELEVEEIRKTLASYRKRINDEANENDDDDEFNYHEG